LQRKIEIFLTILIQLVLAVDQSTYFNLFSSKINTFYLFSSHDMLSSGDKDRYDEDFRKY
jgi:hypothetical protein